MAPGVFEWSKIATAKVNLFVWRAAEGRIPTKIALASRGIQVGSTVCKVCGAAPETADHIFIQCLFAKEVWLLLWSWMYTPGRNHNESLKTRLLEKQDWPRRKERIIYAIHLLAVWSLWKNRNYKVFNDSNATPSKIVEDIKEEAYDWVKLRTKISGISWEDWKKFDLRGGRTLGVAKPKRQDTLETTWKTITEGRSVPLTRHLRKSDTWETHGQSRENRHTDEFATERMTKSDTFDVNRSRKPVKPPPAPSKLSRSGGSGRLKKEPSVGQEELNRRVEAFIKKFNEDMRLQRQESLNQYMEMINRGAH
ncbi:putative reverse transcriptase zinc-binding domain-containing protein [Helianthus annuus]|nr:putative reverse transcriptase zinc-binding domain-containing protein [Helianthus annuus]